MSITDREEAWFPFLRHGPREAAIIGSWARAAFLPPDIFKALLGSLIGEWLEAGADPTVAIAAEAAALAAFAGERISGAEARPRDIPGRPPEAQLTSGDLSGAAPVPPTLDKAGTAAED
jgi:hypothetical protein